MNMIVALVFAIGFAAMTTGSAQGSELPLKRVVLSTSGLAQFTHAGQAAAGTSLELSVRLDQVDDLLKSLTIFDREGAVGAVSLQGKTPLAELFRDLPFGPDALASQAALLNALVGAEIEIEGQVTARGKVFRVEEERTQLPNNAGTTVRHRLTLLTPDKGFVQAVLEELSALRFTEPQTKAQIERALAGLAQNRAKERRSLAIALAGQGTRDVGFTYVVSAPVWKTAYRLVLPKEGGKARLQGWGVIENMTGGDWKDVELSLISGNPVALKQPLYTAFYVDRPEIPITASLRVVPRRDTAEEAVPASASKPSEEPRLRAKRAAAPPPAPMPMIRSGAGYKDGDAYGGVPLLGEIMGEVSQSAVAVESEEAATQVIYRFPAKLSLTAGATMMVPFIDREIGATRTWLYQPETNATRPLAAVRVVNDTDSALPAGIITAFDHGAGGEANFAGDAQLPLTSKGSSKFVTFALDAKTEIRRTDHGTKQTQLGKSVNGELEITVKSRRTIDYEITPPAGEDREIVIEEMRAAGWKPAGDTAGIEETPSRLRYTVAAPKGKTTKVSLTMEHLDHRSVTLSDEEPEEMLATVNGLENESPALKEMIAKLGALVADMNKANARRDELEKERGKIGEDQERIRKNLQTVGQNSDLGRRYLETLKTQEDRLAAIAVAEKDIETGLAAKRKAAEELARGLTL